MKIAEAYVEIRTQRSKAEKEARDTAKGMLSEINDVFKAGIFIAGLNKTIGEASDLNETVSKTRQIFGASASSIESWSKDSAKAMGMSQRAALDAAASFALFGEKAGLAGPQLNTFSTDLTQLASDLASFSNTTPEQAIEAISAALRGESEPIRQYGVLLDDATLKARALELGIYDGSGALTQQQRVLAAQAEILAQTSKAQGDFARTADGAANSQRIAAAQAEDAAASMGRALLPVYTEVVQVVGAMAEVFGDLPAPVQTGVIALAGIVALSGPIRKTVDVVGDLGSAAVKAAGSTGKLAAISGGVIAAIGLAVVAYQALTSEQREIEQRSRDVADALDDQVRQLIESGDAATAAAVGFKALNAALTGGDEDGQKLSRALTTIGLTADDATDVLIGLQKDPLAALKRLGTQAGLTADQAAKLAEFVNASDTALGDFGAGGESAVSDLAESFRLAAAEAGVSFDQMNSIAGAIEELQDQAEKVSIDKVLRPAILDLAAAGGQATLDLLDLAEANTGIERTGSDLLPLYEEFTRLLGENSGALTDTGEAATTAGKKISLMGGWWGDVLDALADVRAERAAEALDNLATSVDDATDEFSGLDQAASDLANALDRVFGRYMTVEDATQALYEGSAKVAESLVENGASLDIATEAGRNNRDAVQEQVQAILDYASAAVASGTSTQEAAKRVDLLSTALRDQLKQAGLTEDEIDTYLTTLGLTPENVTTAIQISKDEEAKRKLGEVLTQLGDIPIEATTELQALVDQGKYEEALTYAEDLLALDTTVTTTVEVDADDALRTWDSLLDAITNYNNAKPVTKVVGVSSPKVLGTETLQRPQGANASPAGFDVAGRLAAVAALVAEGAQAEAEFNTGWKRDVDERIKAADDEVANAYEAGDLSREAYLEYLRGRADDYAKYSDEWAEREREITRITKEQADEATAAEKDALDEREAQHKAYLDSVEALYEAAKNRRAFAEAADSVDTAVSALDAAGTKAYLYGLDPKRTADERAAANAEYQAAQDKAAQALEDRARAGALANGLQDGTEAFANAVRAALQGDAANNGTLADEIAQILLGYPDFGGGATGGATSTTDLFTGGNARRTEVFGQGAVQVYSYGTERGWLEDLATKLDGLRREAL